VSQLRHGLSARRLFRLSSSLGVLDITEYFSETSGGIRTYLLAKSRFVERHPEYRQVLVVPGARDEVSGNDRSRVYRLRGPRIPLNPQYRLLLTSRTPRRIIEAERPDLIEVGSHLLVPWVARWANRGARVPLVWFYHGHLPRLIAPDQTRTPFQRGAEALAWAYVRRLARGCRTVLVASRYLADELTAHGIPQVDRVPLGVDLDFFHPRRRDRCAETRRHYGIPEGRVALFAGRYAREKRLDVVLDAWGEVERRTGIRLACVGDGPAERALRAHPYGGRVCWIPFERDRDRFADLLAATDLYLAPGPYETFGLSALEAMASGSPVLSVDRGGVAERVTASGAGATYRFDSPDALVAAATELAGRDLGLLGADGRAFAEAHHSWDAAFAGIFAVYRRILGR
jgi:alpha-1,6-mannosyltransferase